MGPSSYVNAGLECVTIFGTVRWNDVVVECVLDKTCLVLTAIEPIEIGVILGED